MMPENVHLNVLNDGFPIFFHHPQFYERKRQANHCIFNSIKSVATFFYSVMIQHFSTFKRFVCLQRGLIASSPKYMTGNRRVT